jgi:hypothetical protein
VSVLDRFVAEIISKKHFLTPGNVADLKSALPALVEKPSESVDTDSGFFAVEGEGGGDLIQLSGTLKKLIKTAERMYKNATMSDDADELKKAGATLKQVLDVAIKYSDKINASDRAIKVENALVSAINSYCEKNDLPELKEEFLKFLKEELS